MTNATPREPMEGLAEYLRAQAMRTMLEYRAELFMRWASEVESLRQSAATPEASAEPIGEVRDRPKGEMGNLSWPRVVWSSGICNLPPVGTKLYAAPPTGERIAAPAQADKGPWVAQRWDGGRVVLQSDDFEHDVALIVSGDFGDDDARFSYAERLAKQFNALAPAKESAAPAQAAEPFVVVEAAHRGITLVTLRKDEEPLPFAAGQRVQVLAAAADNSAPTQQGVTELAKSFGPQHTDALAHVIGVYRLRSPHDSHGPIASEAVALIRSIRSALSASTSKAACVEPLAQKSGQKSVTAADPQRNNTEK